MAFPVQGVSHMLRRALNTLDYRLMDHGDRVSYLIMKLYQADGIHTDAKILEVCYLSMFHDIGAYKTEMIDSLMDIDQFIHFELQESLPHSAYGYLFLRDVAFLAEDADAILFHHFTYPKLLESSCQSRLLAARLFLADRIDLMITKGMASSPEDLLRLIDNPVFNPDDVAALAKLQQEHGVLSNIFEHRYLDELLRFMEQPILHDDQMASLVSLLPYAIDFRSKNTVTHTVATVEASVTLANLMHLSEEEKHKIYYGALLHDIGKISVSLMILEKPDRLTDLEFEVMRDHVLLTEYILRDRVSPEIMKIAIRHHEKLDGSGYPYGIKGEDLTQSERIVAVGDILSALMGHRSYKDPFPKERVQGILKDMANKGKICKQIVDCAMEHYDYLAQRVETCNDQALARFETLRMNYQALMLEYIH